MFRGVHFITFLPSAHTALTFCVGFMIASLTSNIISTALIVIIL